jgi:hypothetical protein
MDKNGPRNRRGRKPIGTQAPINLNEVQVSFDKEAFMHAIKTHGVYFTHYRSLPDPTGMQSKGDSHAVGNGNLRSNSDGFIYNKVGEFRALFMLNSNHAQQFPEGHISFATAYVTLPEFYEDCKDEAIILAPYDRLYLKDIEARVVHRQYVEATTVGIDKLQFPATCVEALVDANGVSYKENIDFAITPEGHIKWLTQKRPGWNTAVNRGTVYSIRYRYTPFFVVARIIHEIRVANVTSFTDFTNESRKLERMPYQVQVIRENVYYDTNVDPLKPVPAPDRQVEQPIEGALNEINPGGSLGPKNGSD